MKIAMLEQLFESMRFTMNRGIQAIVIFSALLGFSFGLVLDKDAQESIQKFVAIANIFFSIGFIVFEKIVTDAVMRIEKNIREILEDEKLESLMIHSKAIGMSYWILFSCVVLVIGAWVMVLTETIV